MVGKIYKQADLLELGIDGPWRVEDAPSGYDDRIAFIVWPRYVPDAVTRFAGRWEHLEDWLRPRRVEIDMKSILYFNDRFSFESFWGFKPTYRNCLDIACGYYANPNLNRWGVCVSYARPEDAFINVETRSTK